MNNKLNFWKLTLVFLTLSFLICIGVISIMYAKNKQQKEVFEYKESYMESMVRGNTGDLLMILNEKLDDKKNDAITKSSFYFFVSRYFNNGGDIYEVYDYVNSNQKFSFLKNAEVVYPDIFEKIKQGKLSKKYTKETMLAYLAYLEVLSNSEYASIASLGMAANKYAGLSYLYRNSDKDFSQLAFQKSEMFQKKAEPLVADYFSGKQLDMSIVAPSDVVLGLTNYANSLAILKLVSTSTSPYTSEDVFNFASQYSSNNAVEFYQYTNYVHVVALVTAGKADSQNVKNPLLAIRRIGLIGPNELRLNTVYTNILSSKNIKVTGIYAKSNIIKLAELDQDFKNWLMLNGWKEEDFKIETKK